MASVERLWGATRTETAAAAARRALGHPSADVGAVRVALANGSSPADVGAAAALVAAGGADAVLYSGADALGRETAMLLGEYQVSTVYLIGGTAVLSERLRTDAVSAAGNAKSRRLSGEAREHTAAAVARASAADCVAAAVIANGRSPVDVGTAAALAGALGDSVVLFAASAHDAGESARDAVSDLGPAQVVLVGGADALGAAIEEQLPGARIADAHHAARRALAGPADDCDNAERAAPPTERQGGSTPEGPAPEGSTPEGSTPEGSAPEGSTPEGTRGEAVDDRDAPAPGSPSAPLELSVEAAHTELEIEWLPPEDSGASEVTGYVVQFRMASDLWTFETIGRRVGADARSATLIGLDNGIEFVVRVAAENRQGRGRWVSAAGTPTLADGALGEPLDLRPNASGDDGGILMTWHDPADRGDSALTAYRLQYKLLDRPWSSATELRTDAERNEAIVYDPGRNIGLAFIEVETYEVYEVRVAAVVEAGTGKAVTGRWATSTVYGGGRKPGAVRDLTVEPRGTGSDADLIVFWSIPRYSPTPIRGYRVQWFPWDPTSESARGEATVTSPSYSIPIAGLGAEHYAVRVSAVNEGGEEGPSVDDDTFFGASPSAPTELAAAQREAGVEVSWAAPSYGGLGGVLGYRVRWRPTASSEWNDADSADKGAAERSHAISGLSTGSYAVAVTAVSDSGEGGEATADFIYAGIPGKPSALTLTPGDGRVTAEWSAPSGDGLGTAHYVVQWKDTGADSWDDADEAEVPPRSTAYTIEDLANDHSQSVRVAARTLAGTGPWSDAKDAAAAAGGAHDPRDLVLDGRHTRMHVDWAAPTQASTVTLYRVEWRLGGEEFSEDQAVTLDASKTSTVIYGPLTTSVVYVVRVTALDEQGSSLGNAAAAAEVVSAHDYIDKELIGPRIDDFQWLQDVWIRYRPRIRIADISYLGQYDIGSVTLRLDTYRSIYTVLHELAHHLTILPSAPSNPLSVAIGQFYFNQLVGTNCGGRGVPDREAIADAIAYETLDGRSGDWTYLYACDLISVPPNPETRSVVADIIHGRTPQWFFDIYSSDGTMESVDLDLFFADLTKARDSAFASEFRVFLKDAFGGFCSKEEGFITFSRVFLVDPPLVPYKNPWIDGGCETRWPRILTAESGGGEVHVRWQEPYWTTTPAINAYVLQWKSGAQSYDTSRQSVITDLEDLSHTITGLTSGTEYSVRVAAVNATDPSDMTEFIQSDFDDDDGHQRVVEVTVTVD
ncbi:fibronectin type III domain-containing protein [Candidatus Poriferisodalis sp.]|uniref:fibronectin type III domain-containing protein n=1 Tax=Candidatus Poriferisodalis sp. TaxID=3101277 RepID=UPI003B0202AB